MVYERVLSASAFCTLGAATAVNGFKAVTDSFSLEFYADDPYALSRYHQIQAYLQRCVEYGTIPTRCWPLFGLEPTPPCKAQGRRRKTDDPEPVVFMSDFIDWIRRSGVQAPESWADAVNDSVQWNDQPEPGSNVVSGTPKGRPRQLPDNAQEEANAIGLELYQLNKKMPVKKQIATKLAARYGVAWSTVKDRFSVKAVTDHIKALKQ